MPWLQVAMEVLHSAAGSLDFFSQSAQAVVDLVGLDVGRVLLLKDGSWHTQIVRTRAAAESSGDRQPSRHILAKVRAEKRTFWQVPLTVGSLTGVNTVVAAPILDHCGEVIGALYGDRCQRVPSVQCQPISRLEAMLVELLASGVAAGLARLEQEQAATAARVQFEQFFTPELSRHLAMYPDLLEGRDTEVSILFCDLRGFSRISERLGPAGTFEWIGGVMDELSKCVRRHGGVLVDYVGDELIAMWGAPEEQADHAVRACRAALDMLECLPTLQERWLPLTKEPMDLGIGVNSGTARVGNIGSEHKFKYGPLGNTVNLASRVQKASRYLRATVLITEATQLCLGGDFLTRRLCQVRVKNIEQPVTLFEMVAPKAGAWLDLKKGYEEALALFETKQFRQAAHLLGKLAPEHPDDGPILALLAKAIQCILDEPKNFDPVWTLPGLLP